MTNHVLAAALEYHAMGLGIIPMKRRQKIPSVKTWQNYQSERATEGTIRRWFKDGKSNLAVVLGSVSGNLIARDFDDLQAYLTWTRQFPAWADTLPTVETSRGRHVYATADVDDIRQRFGKSIITMGDGELRAAGLCVLPPSVHPSGAIYRWLNPMLRLPPQVDIVKVGFVTCNIEGIEHQERLEYREDPECRETEKTKIPKTLASGVLEVFQSKDFAPEVLEQIKQAIQRTLPTGKAQRHRLTFELCRELKAILALADAQPMQLQDIVRFWWKLAKVHSPTPFEEHLIDFCEGWGKVKFPKGSEPMMQIMERAKSQPLPEAANQFEQEPLRLLVAICRELQRTTGEGPFYLSSRTAGRLLGVDHTTAHRWLRGLTYYGILALVEAGSQNPKDRKASRFRYLPAS